MALNDHHANAVATEGFINMRILIVLYFTFIWLFITFDSDSSKLVANGRSFYHLSRPPTELMCSIFLNGDGSHGVYWDCIARP